MLVLCSACYGKYTTDIDTNAKELNLKSLVCESFLNFLAMSLHENCTVGKDFVGKLLSHISYEIRNPAVYEDKSLGPFLHPAFEKLAIYRAQKDGKLGLQIDLEFDSRYMSFRDQKLVLPPAPPTLFDFKDIDLGIFAPELYIDPLELQLRQ